MPTFSDFESESLTELVKAFRSRSKAVTYYSSDWNISRESSEEDPERLNVDAKHFNNDLRLSVWSDHVVWFRKCRGPAKNGWKFMLSFHGDASSVTPSAIVDLFIASFWMDRSVTTSRSGPTYLPLSNVPNQKNSERQT